jgi:endo-alpha-1,4-polygalactosaminidase (GH114 family)
LLPYYDGWNREDVSATYDFGPGRYVRQPRYEVRTAQRALRRIALAGLLVLATDYTARNDHAATTQSVADACAAGALPFVSDIDLTRIPAVAARCP